MLPSNMIYEKRCLSARNQIKTANARNPRNQNYMAGEPRGQLNANTLMPSLPGNSDGLTSSKFPFFKSMEQDGNQEPISAIKPAGGKER